jgi:hypothetical protein
MKTLFAGMAVVLGLTLFPPLPAEAQECELCEQDIYYDPIPPHENSYIKHRFDEDEGEDERECDATEEILTEVPVTSGPARIYDECQTCHPEWVYDSGCFYAHPPCWTEDVSLANLVAELDRLVTALASGTTETNNDPAKRIATLVASAENLTVDQARGTLTLSDCAGHLITAWDIPSGVSERFAGRKK